MKRIGQPTLRPGLTLVELVVSVAATAVLVGGLASALVLATRALPQDIAELQGVTNAGAAVDQLAEELATAQSVTEATATTLTFTVPDRDGDGADETVRYAWAGDPGDALTRTYNGGAASNILEDISSFALEYAAKAVIHEVEGDPEVIEDEPLLYVRNTWNLAEARVNNGQSWGETFRPTLPGEAVGWSVAQVWLVARSDDTTSGLLRVQVRSVDGSGLPEDSVLTETAIPEATLPESMHLVVVDFATPPKLSADERAAITIIHQGSGTSAKLQYTTATGAPDGGLLEGHDNDWSLHSSKSLLIVVFGDVYMPGELDPVKRQYLTSVHISIVAGPDDAGRIETLVTPLNVPEIGS